MVDIRNVRMNWIGIAAGILMLVLPFISATWWNVSIGTGAAEVGISPFNITILFFGESFSVPIIFYILLGAKLLVFVGGLLMLIGSLLPKRSWSENLVKFGSTKLLWMIVGLVVVVLLGTLALNHFFDLGLPYLVGGKDVSLSGGIGPMSLPGGVSITLPLTMGLTGTFFLAVFVAGLALAARIYHGRLTFSESSE